MRRRRLLVPVQGFQVVAHELLVETWGADAGLVGLRRPEARGVRCQQLVDQDEFSGAVEAEFELGVGDDDVARARMRRSVSIDFERDAPDIRRVLPPEQFYDRLELDVLVVLARGRFR